MGEASWQRGFDDAFGLRSPITRTAATVEAGRAIYRTRCVACHGERGRGDGPAGVALVPPPADLVLHIPQHTEGELFYYVSRGIPKTAMPAWDAVLSEAERWTVIHYLEELAGGRP